MFLATTAQVELWDKSDDILVLGPWCLNFDRRAEWEGLRYTVLPNPWANNEAVVEAEAYCEKVIDASLDGIAAHLNSLHGVRFSRRYWQILIGPWLLYYVHALYDRYVTLKRTTDSYPGLRTVLLSPASYRTPVDTDDFWSQGQDDTSDVFNLQMYSQILIRLGADIAIAREVTLPAAETATPVPLKQERLVKVIAKRVLLTLSRINRPDVILSAEMPLTMWQWIQLNRAMAGQGGALPFSLALHCDARPINPSLRKRFRDLPSTDEFTRILIDSLPDNVPQIFVEGYAEFREACLKLWPIRPKVIVSAANWYNDEAFKFLAAEFAQRGSRLIGVQHGGGYGTSRVHPWEKHELSITDRWFSFGWRSVDLNEKVRPISHPKFIPLSASKQNGGRSSRDILLVTPGVPRYFCRFESYPVGRLPEIMEWRTRLIKTLPAGLQSALLVRLASHDYGWYQRQRLADACGQIRFDTGRRTLQQTAIRAKLVVVEYPGTAFLEMLSANVPVVLFWDPVLWETRPSAEPHFENLRKAGILWNSPEDAAAKIAAIYEDPWEWWGNAAVQETRRSFVNRFALGKKDWLESWREALVEEIAVVRVSEKQVKLAGIQ